MGHDRAGRARRWHVTKAGGAKRRGRAHVGVQPRTGNHRIAFDDFGALGMSIGNSRLQQGKRQSAPPEATIDKKTNHSPNRLIVNSREFAIAFQPLIALSRSNRTPANRLSVQISKNAGRLTIAHQALESGYPALLR